MVKYKRVGSSPRNENKYIFEIWKSPLGKKRVFLICRGNQIKDIFRDFTHFFYSLGFSYSRACVELYLLLVFV